MYLINFYNNEFAPLKGFNPEFEVEFKVDGTLNDNSDIDKGWMMELAILINTFKGVDRFFPVKAGSQWKFLELKQDRNDAEDNLHKASTIFPTEKDIHDTNFFELLEFLE